ncbi:MULTISPECIES: multicopper oxidase domain-containing protein [Nitrosomonas]|nr:MULTISPECIES: multicopper oxidase domain-containing protein [Nitrosomonas]AKH38584.1 multicopper oxidase [Nitrosomonas communis]UVS60645.1 multicopper oxidase domain-containing protein [Nitrosomonas sp. PLL12]
MLQNKVLLLVSVLMLTILISNPAWAKGGNRVYWIAADEVLWDYAPSFPANPMTGNEFTADERVFVEQGIGRRYLKSVYREYTAGFGAVKPRVAEEKHLGILGPVIRAAVGDRITVHFKNNTRFPASIHPHGVRYSKEHEGAAHSADDKHTSGGIVKPGGKHTYIWEVPERAGPGPNDPSSIAWVYHSHVNESADTNAGLIGPLIISSNKEKPLAVDREFISLFTVFDENDSLYRDINLSTCTGSCDPRSEEFEESNLKHGINGLVYGNNKGYVMRSGERVRWYIIGMGSEVDLHSPHWHGATLLHNGNRVDVTEVLPAATKTLDMQPDVKGNWMYHCHVNDHIKAGMTTTFTVE